MKIRCLSLAFSLFVSLVSGAGAQTSIPINNAGFENPAVANDGAFIGLVSVPGWNNYDPGSIVNNGLNALGVIRPDIAGEFFPDGAPEGLNAALVFLAGVQTNEVGLQQTLTTSLEANTLYTLTVQVGNIASGTSLPGSSDGGDVEYNLDGFPGYRIDLLAGGAVIASDENSLGDLLFEGEFDLATVTFQTGATHPRIGQALGIRLVNLNIKGTVDEPNIEVDFDDVQLTAESLSTNVTLQAGTVVGYEASGSVVVTATRSNTNGNWSVGLTAAPGTASSPADYSLPGNAANSFFTFAAGSATAQGTITLVSDAVTEGTESFTVALGSAPAGVSITGGPRTVQIVEADAAGETNVSLLVGSLEGLEEDGLVTVTAVRGNTNGSLTVGLSATEGTATEPEDYTLPGGAATTFFTFAPGSTLAENEITIEDDLLPESTETFTVALVNAPAGVTVTGGSRTVDVIDDDGGEEDVIVVPGDIDAAGAPANGFSDLLLTRGNKSDLAIMPWDDGGPLLGVSSNGTNIFRLSSNPTLAGFKLFTAAPLVSAFSNDLVLVKGPVLRVLSGSSTPRYNVALAAKLPEGHKLTGAGKFNGVPALFVQKGKTIGVVTNFVGTVLVPQTLFNFAVEPLKSALAGFRPVGVGSYDASGLNNCVLFYSSKLGARAVLPPYGNDGNNVVDILDSFPQKGQKFVAVGQFIDFGGQSSILTVKKSQIFIDQDDFSTYTVPKKNRPFGPR